MIATDAAPALSKNELLKAASPTLAGNISAGLRSLVGGEIHEYTELLEDTRRQAIDRMVQNAVAMGGNAIVAIRNSRIL